jgi:hypothetical protein
LVYQPGQADRNAHQAWQYEYHFKDQVGNLRLAFRTLGRVRQDVEVGFEPDSIIAQRGTGAPTPHLTRVAETRYRAPLMARTGEHVALLNARTGRRLGPALTLPV